MLRYFDNSFKCQLEKLRLDCDHFTESEDEISDRVEQGIIPPVSSENCNLTIFQTCTLICVSFYRVGVNQLRVSQISVDVPIRVSP